LADYREFETIHFIEVIVWRDFYVLNYVDVFGGAPRVMKPFDKGKEKKEEGTSKSDDEDQKLRKVVNPPPFNPMAQFFAQLIREYQG
jgi:hypothetical protein